MYLDHYTSSAILYPALLIAFLKLLFDFIHSQSSSYFSKKYVIL